MHPFLETKLRVDNLLQLEWSLEGEDAFEVRSLLVSRKGDDLSWDDAQVWNKLTELKKYLKKKKRPISICFVGKGILSKTLDTSSESIQDIVGKMIPSGLENEYYVCGLKEAKRVHASLIRKERIEKHLKELESFPIIHTQIGNQALILLPKLFNCSFPIDIQNTRLEENEIGEIQLLSKQNTSPSFELTSENEKINSDFLVCLCNAAEYYFKLLPVSESLPEDVLKMKGDYKYKLILDKITKPLIFILFAIFLANFFYLSRLEEQYIALFTHYELNKEQSEMVNKLENEIRNREELLQRSGWGSEKQISFVSDQIAATVPAKVTLNQLSIHPIKQSIREGTQIDFLWKQIKIEGQVDNSKTLNTWIKDLNALDFVEEVQMTDYQIERKKQFASFQLSLSTR